MNACSEYIICPLYVENSDNKMCSSQLTSGICEKYLAFKQLLHYFSKINKILQREKYRYFLVLKLIKKKREQKNSNSKHFNTKELVYEDFLKVAPLKEEEKSRVIC